MGGEREVEGAGGDKENHRLDLETKTGNIHIYILFFPIFFLF